MGRRGSAVVLFTALTRTRTTKRTYPFKPRVIGVQVAPACPTQWQHICEAALCRETSAEVKISSPTLHPSLHPAKANPPSSPTIVSKFRSVQVVGSSAVSGTFRTSTALPTQCLQAKTTVLIVCGSDSYPNFALASLPDDVPIIRHMPAVTCPQPC